MQASASKVARWQRCFRKGMYADVLELRRRVQSIAPAKGSLLHECLQAYYQGKDWTQPIKNLNVDMENIFEEERAEWQVIQKEAYNIMRSYVATYKDTDANLKTLATEVHFNIPIASTFRGQHMYEGYIDWIFEDAQGHVWVADHKTTKTLPSEVDLYLDLQTLLYVHACTVDENLKNLLGGRKPNGVIFNYIRTKAPKEPTLLKSGGLSKAAIDTDFITYYKAIRDNGLNPDDYTEILNKLKDNQYFRRSKIPYSQKTIDQLTSDIAVTLDIAETLIVESRVSDPVDAPPFPRCMMKNRCAWDCEYSKLCFGELAGANVQGIIDAEYEPRKGRDENDGNQE